MFEEKLIQVTVELIRSHYGQEVAASQIQIQKTRREFDGDFTLVVFPFVKQLRKSPEQIGNELGELICNTMSEVVAFNVIKGFLNLSLSVDFWTCFLKQASLKSDFGTTNTGLNKRVVLEFSSPNTNKPLHLGHIRNNLLGWSVSEILKANRYDVVRVNLVNDRGIHICKSMLAWQKFGKGETPEASGLKGDHLVGKYYVVFDKEYKAEIEKLVADGMDRDDAGKNAPLLKEAQQMLRLWEENDPEIRSLWNKMNGWVYDGFDKTYSRLGISFDKTYYESNTYLLGKQIVEKGLEDKALFRKEDTSVWADLTLEGLDEKLLLRSDGTSVYMTQDLGTAKLRYDEFVADTMIYVVGNEQNYHFDALKTILKKLGYSWAEGIHHLSYGMVELPEGKMKSREGTVVDADDLMEEMKNTAKEISMELGKLDDFESNEAEQLYYMLAMGALKYFILKVDPVKNMLFNPTESIDFNGNTGPFIQYTHARICSILRRAEINEPTDTLPSELHLKERNITRLLYEFPQIVAEAGRTFSPALIANYVFELAKEYNSFYQDIPVLKEQDETLRSFRLMLSSTTARVLAKAMKLLGVDVPEKM